MWQAELKKKKFETLHTDELSGDQSEAVEILEKTKPLNPNYLFLDGERFNKNFVNLLTKANLKIIKIDDNYKANNLQIWAVVNPNIYAKTKYYKKSNFKKVLAGQKYILLRQEFQKKTKEKNKNQILVALGVAAKKNFITVLKSNLNKFGFNVQIAKKYNASEMVKAIDAASAVICGASVTLHEVWARGKMAIPIYQAKDQALFYKWCKNQCISVVSSKQNQKRYLKKKIKQISYLAQNKTQNFIPKVSPYGADMVIEKLFGKTLNPHAKKN